jgi:CHASE3 domain sensor protein
MKLVRGIILILLLSICIFPEVCQAAQVKSAGNSKNDPIGMNQEELHNAIMSFTDSFMTIVLGATENLENELPSPEARHQASRVKVYTFSSAIDIASGPSPGIALLDMVVMVTLNRMVWEEYWQPKVFGKPADAVVKTLQKTERDIWSIVAKVLTSDQQKELNDLIVEWRHNNPDQIGVNYIRFSDFGNLGKKPSLSKVKLPGGLLAPVKEAAQAADEIRITAERTKYMISRMQLIANFQVELIFRELMLEPESKQLLFDLNSFRESAEQFAKLMDLLPQQIADEREDAIIQFMNSFSKERNATIRQAVKELAKERETTLTDIAKIIERERTALLTAIEEYDNALQEDIVKIVSEFNTAAEHRIDHIFKRFIQLIVILSICLLIIVIVHHLLSKRLSS